MNKRTGTLMKQALPFVATVLLIGVIALPVVEVAASKSTCCPPCMVSYWKLNEASGAWLSDCADGNDGGMLTDGDGNDPEWVSGIDGSAVYFAGDAPDVISIGDAPNLNFGTGPFALEAWIRYQGPTDGSVLYPCIVSKRPGPPGSDPKEGFALCLSYWSKATLGSLLLRIGDKNYVPCSTAVDDGQWHHVVVTRCGSNQVEFYVDGQLDGTATSNKSASSDGGLSLGLDASSSYDTAWKGRIDEVAVYNCCLSPGEIQNHYQLGLSGEGYCSGKTVHNIDTDKWYSTIQAAIDDPQTHNHHTIEVYDHPNGKYLEHVVVNKEVTLKAAPGAHPIIDGESTDSPNLVDTVVKIMQSNVLVKGFTIQNGWDRGVSVHGSHVEIVGNRILDNGMSYCTAGYQCGVFLGGDNNKVVGNEIIGNARGIQTGCSDTLQCTIEDNVIKDSILKGINLASANYFTIIDNTIVGNTYGIFLYRACGNHCHDNLITRNQVTENLMGIKLDDGSNNNRIQFNTISDNNYEGVIVSGTSHDNLVFRNKIFDNGGYGVKIDSAQVMDNTIFDNLLINGSHNAYDAWTNTLWNIQPIDVMYGLDENIVGRDWFGGNFWSDYSGPDANNDGIGDTPYTIQANGIDQYPLVP